ncbi:MAG: hypothetical protein GY786_01835 [Proteobacteria bacterium]|nr:hypothetical protein [Pseudomonadota bacterium]
MKNQLYSFLLFGVILFGMNQSLFAQIESLHLDDNNGQNESWMYFGHTALNNTDQHSIELNLWMKDLGETDIRLQRLRYDATFLKTLQVGVQTNGGTSSDGSDIFHSAYGHAKYTIVGQSISAVSIAVGVRKRVFWNSLNTEFDTGNSTDEENDSRNDLTVFGALTGGVRISSLDLMGNFYIDNQTVTIGTKLSLTPEIKLLFENIGYYYSNATVTSDSVIGIQFYNPLGGVATLAYQTESEQALLGAGLSW